MEQEMREAREGDGVPPRRRPMEKADGKAPALVCFYSSIEYFYSSTEYT
jgi:hypothetical protein